VVVVRIESRQQPHALELGLGSIFKGLSPNRTLHEPELGMAVELPKDWSRNNLIATRLL
jgi:hypothetical protein